MVLAAGVAAPEFVPRVVPAQVRAPQVPAPAAQEPVDKPAAAPAARAAIAEESAPEPEPEPEVAAASAAEDGQQASLIDVTPAPAARPAVDPRSTAARVPRPPRAPRILTTGADPQPAPANTRREEKQETLQFEPVTRGRFEKSEPTIVDGQDLDVPTFLRRNLKVS
jgi:hypothetical protein